MSHLKSRAHHLIRRYRQDLPFQGRVSLLGSTVFNLCYALMKLGFGLCYRSFWFGAIAVYYLLLAVTRAFLLGMSHRTNGNLPHEYRVAHACGWLLFALNLALSAVTVQMVLDGKGYHYPGYLIFAAAAYAFYAATMAIVQLVRFRKLKSPVLSASKVLNLAVALVSMLSLQTAMLTSFGDGSIDGRAMNALTGGAVCVLIFILAVLLVVTANRQLRQIRGITYGTG